MTLCRSRVSSKELSAKSKAREQGTRSKIEIAISKAPKADTQCQNQRRISRFALRAMRLASWPRLSIDSDVRMRASELQKQWS